MKNLKTRLDSLKKEVTELQKSFNAAELEIWKKHIPATVNHDDFETTVRVRISGDSFYIKFHDKVKSNCMNDITIHARRESWKSDSPFTHLELSYYSGTISSNSLYGLEYVKFLGQLAQSIQDNHKNLFLDLTVLEVSDLNTKRSQLYSEINLIEGKIREIENQEREELILAKMKELEEGLEIEKALGIKQWQIGEWFRFTASTVSSSSFYNVVSFKFTPTKSGKTGLVNIKYADRSGENIYETKVERVKVSRVRNFAIRLLAEK